MKITKQINFVFIIYYVFYSSKKETVSDSTCVSVIDCYIIVRKVILKVAYHLSAVDVTFGLFMRREI